jgi:hypothetical protein
MVGNFAPYFLLTALVLAYIRPADALHLEHVNPHMPNVALCITGRVPESFSRTAANLKSVLIDKMRHISNVHVFIHVKGKPSDHITHAMQSLQPVRANVYSQEEPFYNTEWPGGSWAVYTTSAWTQRYQWQQCWDMITSSERALSMQYDFVIRTRPDLLYSPTAFAPDGWRLWHAKAERKRVGYGVCKCRRTDMVNGSEKFPVQDVFFVGPRDAAAIFMTTWERRHNITKTQLRKCWMYYDIRDYWECVTVADLAEHGFEIEAIPEISSLRNEAFSKWAFGACEMPAQPWFITHHLPRQDQACILGEAGQRSVEVPDDEAECPNGERW